MHIVVRDRLAGALDGRASAHDRGVENADASQRTHRK